MSELVTLFSADKSIISGPPEIAGLDPDFRKKAELIHVSGWFKVDLPWDDPIGRFRAHEWNTDPDGRIVDLRTEGIRGYLVLVQAPRGIWIVEAGSPLSHRYIPPESLVQIYSNSGRFHKRLNRG